MSIEKTDENKYKFSLVVIVTDAQNNIIEEIPQNGELILKSGKIDHFSIDEQELA